MLSHHFGESNEFNNVKNQNNFVESTNFFSWPGQVIKSYMKPSHLVLDQPYFCRGSRGWGGLKHKTHAAVSANGSTMVRAAAECTVVVVVGLCLSYNTQVVECNALTTPKPC